MTSTLSGQHTNQELSGNVLDTIFLEELYSILDRLTTCYDEHCQLLGRKRNVLVGSSNFAARAEELKTIDRALLALNRQAGQAEKERRQLQNQSGCADWTLGQIIHALNAAPDNPALAKLTQRFTRLRQKLERALIDSQQINLEIRGLLELSLDWIQETVDIVAAACQPEGASYTAQGGKGRSFASKPETPSISFSPSSTVSHSA